MELRGTIIMKLPLAQGVSKAGNEWKKQEYIIEVPDGDYTRKVCFNLWGDKIDQYNLQEGETVTVHINLESREFNGRWYTDVRAWRIDRGDAAAAPGADSYASAQSAPYNAPAPADPFAAAPAATGSFATGAEEAVDDLPF